MMYIHYCKCCNRIHMLNGHKMYCPKCDNPLTELRMSYLEYVGMTREERALFRLDCKDPELLEDYAAHYRMYKYSKWYKKLHEQKPEPEVVVDSTGYFTNDKDDKK